MPRVPLIRNKHALRKCFASIDSSYSCPEYQRGNLAHLQRPVKIIFPHIRAWVGWIVWFKAPSQKFTSIVVQCRLGPDSFGTMILQILLLCPPLKMSGLWQTFCFKTSSTESSYIYLYGFPKRPFHQIMSTSTGINKNPTNLQKTLRSRKNIKDFLAFLYPDIDSKSK